MAKTKKSAKDQIIELISQMSVLELSELVKDIEKEFGIQAVPQVVGVTPGAAPQSAEEKPAPAAEPESAPAPQAEPDAADDAKMDALQKAILNLDQASPEHYTEKGKPRIEAVRALLPEGMDVTVAEVNAAFKALGGE